MKKILKINLGAAALLLAFSVNAWSLPAYPVSVGDNVQVTAIIDTDAQYEGTFLVNNLTTGSSYATFCLELSEPVFGSPAINTVDGISDYAMLGGYGGGTDGLDPISGASKWLYYNFLTKNILAATGQEQNDMSMQLAFWKLEDELDETNSKSYFDQYLADTTAMAYVSAAEANDAAGAMYDVMVVNLVNEQGAIRQSHPVAPVPEPGTMVLLGAGLLGLAICGKRRLNKNV